MHTEVAQENRRSGSERRKDDDRRHLARRSMGGWRIDAVGRRKKMARRDIERRACI